MPGRETSNTPARPNSARASPPRAANTQATPLRGSPPRAPSRQTSPPDTSSSQTPSPQAPPRRPFPPQPSAPQVSTSSGLSVSSIQPWAVATGTMSNPANRRPPLTASRGQQSPASSRAGTYGPQQLPTLESRSIEATEHQLVQAADHVVQVLNSHGIPYAIMGGFSLRMRGSPRQTVDVDFAVGTNMLQLRTAFASNPRAILPFGPVSGVMRIFVNVSGLSSGGLEDTPVCVDLICEASLGAPGNILNASEEVEGDTDGGPRRYRVLDIAHIFAAKLAAFAARGDMHRHDFGDLMWLLNSGWAAHVEAVSGSAPLEQRRALMAAVDRLRPKPSAAFVQRLKRLLRLA